MRKIRVILAGPLPPPLGGDTRHFRTLVDDLSVSDEYAVVVVNTSRGDAWSQPTRNIGVAVASLLKVLSHIGAADAVSVHASDRGMNVLGAALVMLGKLVHRPVVVRLFGGSYGDSYNSAPVWKQWWMRRFVLSADVVLLQTQRMIGQLEGVASGRLVWFCTYLPAGSTPVVQDATARSCRRFVFLGHLWRSKGVGLILEAASKLPREVAVDLWGPLDEYSADQVRDLSRGRVVYRGVLKREEVMPTLANYDCLLLPTQHPGEGYPGVIAEAFTAGIPVITTKWLAIPEIVDESCGLVIAPGSAEALQDAMNRLHDDDPLWHRLCAGATQRAALFSHSRWSAVFTDVVESVVSGGRRESRRDARGD